VRGGTSCLVRPPHERGWFPWRDEASAGYPTCLILISRRVFSRRRLLSPRPAGSLTRTPQEPAAGPARASPERPRTGQAGGRERPETETPTAHHGEERAVAVCNSRVVRVPSPPARPGRLNTHLNSGFSNAPPRSLARQAAREARREMPTGRTNRVGKNRPTTPLQAASCPGPSCDRISVSAMRMPSSSTPRRCSTVIR
jgi:hypothetical protein